jgi:acetyl-CoA synthetase
MRYGDEAVARHDLSSVRITCSSGEPWTDTPWHWFFDHVCKRRLPLLNISGGTEVGCLILTGTVHHKLKPCSFGGPVPGMGADVVDEAGRSCPPGQVGELVLRQTSIGLTKSLWRDDQRYVESYWNVIPGLWVHGDFAQRDADGCWYILGRSDDTIKVAGKRVGPAEIESALVSHAAVTEAAAVGVPDAIKGQAVVAFVVLQSGVEANDALRAELIEWVANGLGKPLAPKTICFVQDIPKTRNAKVMRRVIRAAYVGEPPGDLAALVNPEAVEAIRALGKG